MNLIIIIKSIMENRRDSKLDKKSSKKKGKPSNKKKTKHSTLIHDFVNLKSRPSYSKRKGVTNHLLALPRKNQETSLISNKLKQFERKRRFKGEVDDKRK